MIICYAPKHLWYKLFDQKSYYYTWHSWMSLWPHQYSMAFAKIIFVYLTGYSDSVQHLELVRHTSMKHLELIFIHKSELDVGYDRWIMKCWYDGAKLIFFWDPWYKHISSFGSLIATVYGIYISPEWQWWVGIIKHKFPRILWALSIQTCGLIFSLYLHFTNH